ncbi:MAG: GAF domain-containing protein [Planctomycetota bacterium]
MSERSIFRLLFRVAARAPQLDRRTVLDRIVTGIANHYDALTCRLWTVNGSSPLAGADEDETLELLDPISRSRLREMEELLVGTALERGAYASALDLDPEGELTDFLHDVVGVHEVFAFPITADGRTFGAIVLYLPLASPPLAEADQQALMAVGELVRMAAHDRAPVRTGA